jgi:hypothetical protein
LGVKKGLKRERRHPDGKIAEQAEKRFDFLKSKKESKRFSAFCKRLPSG